MLNGRGLLLPSMVDWDMGVVAKFVLVGTPPAQVESVVSVLGAYEVS